MNDINAKHFLYSLNNVSNYKNKLDISINTLLYKYNCLIIEYLRFVNENINLKSTSLNKFIIIRGFETISHVFNIILYYSKNSDLAFYHGQKSFYYYVEFITQITDEENVFLNLNSRDASIFVYKKTIYDINKEFSKNKEKMNDNEIEKFNILNINLRITKKILHFLIINMNSDVEISKDTMKIIITKLEKKLDKINNNKMNKMLDNIELFLEHIGKDISNDKYFEILEFYLKKNSKIKNLLLDDIDETELNYNLLNKTPELFVDWIFTK